MAAGRTNSQRRPEDETLNGTGLKRKPFVFWLAPQSWTIDQSTVIEQCVEKMFSLSILLIEFQDEHWTVFMFTAAVHMASW